MTRDAVRAVATGDEVAIEPLGRAIVPERDRRPRRRGIPGGNIAHAEEDLPARLEPRRDEILHDLLLRIQRHTLAAGERLHVDVMRAAGETQVHAAVEERLAIQA